MPPDEEAGEASGGAIREALAAWARSYYGAARSPREVSRDLFAALGLVDGRLRAAALLPAYVRILRLVGTVAVEPVRGARAESGSGGTLDYHVVVGQLESGT